MSVLSQLNEAKKGGFVIQDGLLYHIKTVLDETCYTYQSP